jgi:Cu-Zn family superoxide dismutase
MKRLLSSVAGLSAVLLTGCASTQGDDAAPPLPAGPATVTTDLRDPGGGVLARAFLEEVGDSVRVRLEAVELVQGAYGAHVHTTGRCDAPAFASAGPHWNPGGQQHGKDNPQGMHRGDLPNLLVGTDRRGSFEYTIPGASLSGQGPDVLLDADGAAVVLHQQADDFRTDPSGNSGARLACGVLG